MQVFCALAEAVLPLYEFKLLLLKTARSVIGSLRDNVPQAGLGGSPNVLSHKEEIPWM